MTRIGLFGLLGSGNLGNDGSCEAVLDFLRAEHPDAVVTAMCAGPTQVTARYGLPATALHWYQRFDSRAHGLPAIALKAVGKLVDPVRTALWVRRNDVVLVPGMGVLEATLPLRPWGFPYALLSVCAAGRLFGTSVALVCVGADDISRPWVRRLLRRAASLAHYRSYRDTLSRDAMRRMGVDTSGDEVYADLAFALAVPERDEPVARSVGVGVMDFHGGNDDRAGAAQIHRGYVGALRGFVRWLVDDGRQVRLFVGDRADATVVDEIMSGVDSDRVTAARVSSLPELLGEMSAVETVVATRYHNVLCALKLAKPTLSIGYAAKHDALMAEMGLADFCLPARSLEVDRLVARFTALQRRATQLRQVLRQRNEAAADLLKHQFATLTAVVAEAAR